MPEQGRYWCFTINNYTPEEASSLARLENQHNIQFLIAEYEVGENGTPHIQGYVEFKKRIRLTSIKKIPGLARAHLETAKGSAEQNIQYCTKENREFVRIGAPVNQGKKGGRSDLAAACALLKTSGIKRMAEEYPTTFVKHSKGFQELSQIYDRPIDRRLNLKVTLLIGNTGTGKTRTVHEKYEPDELYIWGGDRWFDGYKGQRVALFDDYNGEIPLTNFLKLLDIYAVQAPVKGNFVWFKPELIYITSNYPPEQWYPKDRPEHINALKRRIHETIQFG